MLLANENAAALGVADRFAARDARRRCPPTRRYDEIWSNPPIRIGKEALHELLLDLAAAAGARRPRRAGGRQEPRRRLAAALAGRAGLADAARLASAKGFRVLEVRAAVSTLEEEAESTVEWLELFFDLVVVAAVAVLTEGLREDPTLAGLGLFALLYGAIWLSWVSVVLYADVAGSGPGCATGGVVDVPGCGDGGHCPGALRASGRPRSRAPFLLVRARPPGRRCSTGRVLELAAAAVRRAGHAVDRGDVGRRAVEVRAVGGGAARSTWLCRAAAGRDGPRRAWSSGCAATRASGRPAGRLRPTSRWSTSNRAPRRAARAVRDHRAGRGGEPAGDRRPHGWSGVFGAGPQPSAS